VCIWISVNLPCIQVKQSSTIIAISKKSVFDLPVAISKVTCRPVWVSNLLGGLYMKIGFIGIGQMGKHMSRRILEGGYDLTINDLNKAAGAFLIEKGAKWANTPQVLAQSCEIIFMSLPTPKDVEDVVFGQNGLKSGWKRGDIVVDMSTNSPSTIRQISEDGRRSGVVVLDAPVSGGTTGAEKGTLAIMVGGDSVALERVRPILETLGKKIFPVGPVGCGNIAKLVNNLIALSTNAITAEGFVLGVKAGMDPRVLYDIIRVSTGNSWSLEQLPSTVFDGNFEPGFKLSLGRKDMGLALTLGKDSDVPLPIARVVQQVLDATMEAGYAEKSVQAVILPLEKKTGVKVRIPK
jgi:2-hydroxymethylglutarate dehydrogenase